MDFLVQNALDTMETSTDTTVDSNIGQANIKVLGCGGAGNNMADWLYRKGISGAEVISVNTDKLHLDHRESDKKILIGRDTTRGLGAGGNPDIGAQSAREQIHELKAAIQGADMVFVCAGLGGGTGSGVAPVAAQVAQEQGAIVIGVVTMPFSIEKARIDKAEFALKQLREVSNTVIVIDNNRLSSIAGNLPIRQAFAVANELISTMIKSIVEIISVPSLINLDYADVRAIMSSGGVSVTGIGEADGDKRVDEATKRALSNPLLDVSYDGSTGAMIHITGGPDMTLDEAERVGEIITAGLDADANVIWGARIDDEMRGKLRIMTIITGVKSPYVLGKGRARPSPQALEMNHELGLETI
jgi:cell division protein FtsZ